MTNLMYFYRNIVLDIERSLSIQRIIYKAKSFLINESFSILFLLYDTILFKDYVLIDKCYKMGVEH